MYYDIEFVKDFEKNNLIFVFHNEKGNVETNIISPMESVLTPMLKTKYFDRSFEESLVSLRYPDAESTDTDFAYFFDSPFCAAFQHKEFKGVFIIDVSNYTSATSRALTDLVQYIKENVSAEFCFICLFDSSIKEGVKKRVKSLSIDNVCYINLELDDEVLKEFSQKFEQGAYDKLKKSLNNPTIRTKSYNYVDNILNRVLENTVSEDSAIAKLTVATNNDKERKIGF